jgi:tetratricopeptide (TPR) repeat protein
MAKEAGSRAFVTKAKSLADAGKFADAIKVLQDGLKQYPSFTSARVLLGEIYWTSGDVPLARVELEQVTKAVPDNFAAHRRLDLIYREVGDYPSALESCRIVLQANPRDQEMRSLQAAVQALTGSSAPSAVPEEGKTDAPATEPPSLQIPIEMPQTFIDLPVFSNVVLAESDALDSETLAELYLVQGECEKGLAVYRRLAAKSPGNTRLRDRIEAIEKEEVKVPDAAGAPGQAPEPAPQGREEPQGRPEAPALEREESPAPPAAEDTGAMQKPPPAEKPLAQAPLLETPAQTRRKAGIRRLEGWLQVVRERRRA